MTTAWFKKLATGFLVLSVIARPTLAEDLNQIVQTLEQGLGSTGGVEAPQMASVPQVSPGQPAPPPADRANKNGAAKALAMAGAAMAMVSCAKLMKDAQNEPDPTTKAMLQNMAMQQCSQGMKDMGDAMKNDDNKKTLTMNDTPKMAQLTAQPMSPSKNTVKEPTFVPPTSAPQTPQYEEAASATPTPAPGASEEKSELVKEKPDLPTTTLEPIEGARLGFDESAKNNTGTTTPNPAGLGLAALATSSTRSPSNDDLKKLLEKANADEKAARKGHEELPIAEGDGGFTGGSAGTNANGSGDGKAEDPFAAMMSQMFGQQPGAVPVAFGGTSDIGGLAAAKSAGSRATNIFQLATYRYRVVTYTDGKIRTRSGASIKKIPTGGELTASNP